jgi:hypothetical protein
MDDLFELEVHPTYLHISYPPGHVIASENMQDKWRRIGKICREHGIAKVLIEADKPERHLDTGSAFDAGRPLPKICQVCPLPFVFTNTNSTNYRHSLRPWPEPRCTDGVLFESWRRARMAGCKHRGECGPLALINGIGAAASTCITAAAKLQNLSGKKSKPQVWLEYRVRPDPDGFLGMLPRPACGSLMTSLAGLAYHLLGGLRHVAITNLNIAFPELSEADRNRLAKGRLEILDAFSVN